MKSWILGNVQKLAVGVAALCMAGSLGPSAQAAAVHGVSVTKGDRWVRINVDAPGSVYRIHELPVGNAAYRSIAIDVPNGYIAGGLEPKNRVPVNKGLVAQLRVKQMRGFVRVFVDVISFPKYQTAHVGGEFVLGIDPYHFRNGNPIAPQYR